MQKAMRWPPACAHADAKDGIEAIYRRANTSKPAPRQKVYSYLLKSLPIVSPSQVWAMDIGLLISTENWL